jgi:hypothetical protein
VRLPWIGPEILLDRKVSNLVYIERPVFLVFWPLKRIYAVDYMSSRYGRPRIQGMKEKEVTSNLGLL